MHCPELMNMAQQEHDRAVGDSMPRGHKSEGGKSRDSMNSGAACISCNCCDLSACAGKGHSQSKGYEKGKASGKQGHNYSRETKGFGKQTKRKGNGEGEEVPARACNNHTQQSSNRHRNTAEPHPTHPAPFLRAPWHR